MGFGGAAMPKPAPPRFAPARASTSYGPGSVTTRASGGTGPYDYASLLDDLIRKRVAGPRRPAAPRPGAGGLGAKTTVIPIDSGPATESGGMRDMLAQRKMGAEMAQLNAAASPPSLRPKYIGGATLLDADPKMMNAYQREMYLPQGSSFGSPDTGAERRAGEDEDFTRFIQGRPGEMVFNNEADWKNAQYQMLLSQIGNMSIWQGEA